MAKIDLKADTNRVMPDNIVRLPQARYCSNCGQELEKCQCNDQTITISIGVSKELIRAFTGLTALIPRVQISTTNRCSSCGHPEHSGPCSAEGCTCK